MTRKRKKSDGADRSAQVNKVLDHHLRVRILTLLEEAMHSPKELSKLLEEGLSQVSYHVKVLKDAEAIEEVKSEPRRGALEHYYRSTRKIVTAGQMDAALTKIAQALSDGGKDHHRVVVEVDAILATVGRKVYPDDTKGGKSP